MKELTEEGIPFLILFHQRDDTESLEKFQQEVARQLISEKGMHRGQTASGSSFIIHWLDIAHAYNTGMQTSHLSVKIAVLNPKCVICVDGKWKIFLIIV